MSRSSVLRSSPPCSTRPVWPSRVLARYSYTARTNPGAEVPMLARTGSLRTCVREQQASNDRLRCGGFRLRSEGVTSEKKASRRAKATPDCWPLVFLGGTLAVTVVVRRVARRRISRRGSDPAEHRRAGPASGQNAPGYSFSDRAGDQQTTPVDRDSAIERGINGRWMRSYYEVVRSQSWLWVLPLLFLLMAWSSDQAASWFVTIVLTFLGAMILSSFVPLTPWAWWREMGRGPTLVETLTRVVVLALVMSFVLLGRAVMGGSDRLGRWLQTAGRQVDSDLLLATCVVALAAMISVVDRLRLHLRYRRRPGCAELRHRLHAAHERMWVLCLITIALLPAAVRASWAPNILASVLIPIGVLHAREHRRRFLLIEATDSASRTDPRGELKESALGRESTRSKTSAETERAAEAERWLADQPIVVRYAYLLILVVAALPSLAMLVGIGWACVTTSTIALRLILSCTYVFVLARLLTSDLGKSAWEVGYSTLLQILQGTSYRRKIV